MTKCFSSIGIGETISFAGSSLTIALGIIACIGGLFSELDAVASRSLTVRFWMPAGDIVDSLE